MGAVTSHSCTQLGWRSFFMTPISLRTPSSAVPVPCVFLERTERLSTLTATSPCSGPCALYTIPYAPCPRILPIL